MKYIILFICATLSLNIAAQQTIDNRSKEVYEANKTIIESGQYQFNADWVFEGKTRGQLQGQNTIRIDHTTTTIKLTTLEGNTIDVSGTVSDYKVNLDDENAQLYINFKIDDYSVSLKTAPNGHPFVEISSDNRDISYRGRLGSL